MNRVGMGLDKFKVNHLRKLSVGFWYDECFVPNLNNWVQSAVEKNAKEISLSSYGPYGRRGDDLPQMLPSHSSLTTLKIDSSSREDLKSSSLSDVFFPSFSILGDLHSILCGHPRGFGFTILNDELTPLMKDGFTRMNIFSSAKSLQYVKELEWGVGEGCQKFLSMLESEEGLKIPTSTRRCLTLNLGRKFSIPGILCILKSLPNLETLTIQGDYRNFFIENRIPEQGGKYLENIDLVLPHLKTINITFFKGESMMILAELLLKSANVLQKMTVSYNSKYESEKLSKALLAFPRASPEAIVECSLNITHEG